jgi:signal transduction histidine kinase
VASVPVEGNDEIGILATSFNALAERLRSFHASLEDLVARRTAELQAEIVERKRAEGALEEEQRILRKLLEIHERQQKLVATEIHDNLTQPLTGALMSLDTSRGGLQQGGKDGAMASLERTRELLAETIGLSRRLMSGLRPPILDDLGPIAAIESLVAESQVVGKQQIDFNCQVQFDRLSPGMETIIFRIVQEGLRNAQQHSQSDRIEVGLRQIDDHLRIEVRDWGIGFDPATADVGHFGLESIRERCRLLGGEAIITSTPGQGTLLSIDLPLTAAVEPMLPALGDL